MAVARIVLIEQATVWVATGWVAGAVAVRAIYCTVTVIIIAVRAIDFSRRSWGASWGAALISLAITVVVDAIVADFCDTWVNAV